MLLLHQAQPIYTEDGVGGERETPYNVLDEESDIETQEDLVEIQSSEPPVPVGEPGPGGDGGQYAGPQPPPMGEEYNYGPEGPPGGEYYQYQEPPDYRMLDELKILSDSFGENGPRMLAEWIDEWREMTMLDNDAKMEQWYLKIKATYGPRLLGHKECQRKSFLYISDDTFVNQEGKMPYDEYSCGWSCQK